MSNQQICALSAPMPLTKSQFLWKMAKSNIPYVMLALAKNEENINYIIDYWFNEEANIFLRLGINRVRFNWNIAIHSSKVAFRMHNFGLLCHWQPMIQTSAKKYGYTSADKPINSEYYKPIQFNGCQSQQDDGMHKILSRADTDFHSR